MTDGGPVETAWAHAAEADGARARGEHAVTESADAANAWMALERPYSEAQARLSEALAANATGDRVRAAQMLNRVRTIADTLGSKWLIAAVRDSAKRHRLKLDATTAPNDGLTQLGETNGEPFDLTPREFEVLTHLARGASNREIAETLVISDKTASVHVSRILRKLGAATRTQAAAIAYRSGLEI